jgi:hypothetical protein
VNTLNFSESGWWGRILSAMKVLWKYLLLPIFRLLWSFLWFPILLILSTTPIFIFCVLGQQLFPDPKYKATIIQFSAVVWLLVVIGFYLWHRENKEKFNLWIRIKKAKFILWYKKYKVKESTEDENEELDIACSSRVAGIYEGHEGESMVTFKLLNEGLYQAHEDGLNVAEGIWWIVNEEVHIGLYDQYGVYVDVNRINTDGSLTEVAEIIDDQREDVPIEEQFTYKKIK